MMQTEIELITQSISISQTHIMA